MCRVLACIPITNSFPILGTEGLTLVHVSEGKRILTVIDVARSAQVCVQWKGILSDAMFVTTPN